MQWQKKLQKYLKPHFGVILVPFSQYTGNKDFFKKNVTHIFQSEQINNLLLRKMCKRQTNKTHWWMESHKTSHSSGVVQRTQFWFVYEKWPEYWQRNSITFPVNYQRFSNIMWDINCTWRAIQFFIKHQKT